jgi:phosphate transport system protein
MSVHLRQEIEQLKGQVLGLSAQVEEAVWRAVRAVQTRDPRLAEQVIAEDAAVDEQEVQVEEECLKLLALYQPVASDLRFLVTVLKLNNDLERIGDLAVNIAQRAQGLAGQPAPSIPFDFLGMATRTQEMLRLALDALVNVDPRRARDVCAMDDQVDVMHRDMYALVQRGIQSDPARVDQYLTLLTISRNLERIADHATNIAEDVLYMFEGRVVRHRVAEYRTPSEPDCHAAGAW